MIETKFRKTEVGIIPEDWEVVSLEKIANNFTGLTYSPINVEEYGTLVLRSSNIKDFQLTFGDNVFVNMVNLPERTIVRAGDILICVRNGSRKLIGKCAIITKEAEGCAFGAFMTVLRPISINSDYLFNIWQSNCIQKQIEENLGATINQITNSDIRRYVVAIAKSSQEQFAIATTLTDIDELITALDKKIAKKKLIKQGAMQQLLTGKKRLPGFSGEWVSLELSKICSFLGGGTPSTVNKEYWEGNIPWISSSDLFVENLNFIQISRYITEVAIKQSATVLCPKNTIHLVTRVGLGKVAVSSSRLCTSQDFTNIVVLENDSYFVALLLQSAMRTKKEESQGTSIKGITVDEIKKLILFIPQCKSEQTAIATLLSDIDKEISDLEARRDKYKLVKQGMMQKLLTGQIRLI